LVHIQYTTAKNYTLGIYRQDFIRYTGWYIGWYIYIDVNLLLTPIYKYSILFVLQRIYLCDTTKLNQEK